MVIGTCHLTPGQWLNGHSGHVSDVVSSLMVVFLFIFLSRFGPWNNQKFELFSPTKYIIHKSLKVSHWLSELRFCSAYWHNLSSTLQVKMKAIVPQIYEVNQGGLANQNCCRVNLQSDKTTIYVCHEMWGTLVRGEIANLQTLKKNMFIKNPLEMNQKPSFKTTTWWETSTVRLRQNPKSPRVFSGWFSGASQESLKMPPE